MEKTLVKRISAAVIALLVAFSMLYVSAGEVNAAETWELGIDDTYYVGMSGYYIWVSAWDDATDNSVDGTITSAVSSNTGVVKIGKQAWTDENGKTMYVYNMNFKKAGTSQITVNFTKPDGSAGTLSKTVRVKKYPNQIKSLKVNGKKVKTSKGKKRYEYNVKNFKKTKTYVKMGLKKGWKISGVYVYAYNSRNDKSKEFKVKKSTIKNGKAIKFPKAYDYLNITIDMQKGNQMLSYYIGVTRNKQ